MCNNGRLFQAANQCIQKAEGLELMCASAYLQRQQSVMTKVVEVMMMMIDADCADEHCGECDYDCQVLTGN